MKSVPIQTINLDAIGLLDKFKTAVELYSCNALTIEPRNENFDIQVSVGMFTQDQAYELADQIQANGYLFIGYAANPTAAFLATYYYPKRNCTITTVPLPTSARSLAFEFSHAVQLMANQNGAQPPIEILDSNFPDDAFIRNKFACVVPHLDLLTPMTLTEVDVKKLQCLEGFIDPAGALYWIGKTLDQYLTARIADKVKQLESLIV